MRIRLARKIFKNPHRYSLGKQKAASRRLGYNWRSWEIDFIVMSRAIRILSRQPARHSDCADAMVMAMNSAFLHREKS